MVKPYTDRRKGRIGSGDANNERTFIFTDWFRVYLHRKGYGYCRDDSKRLAGKTLSLSVDETLTEQNSLA
jgi:hypothetical protein